MGERLEIRRKGRGTREGDAVNRLNVYSVHVERLFVDVQDLEFTWSFFIKSVR